MLKSQEENDDLHGNSYNILLIRYYEYNFYKTAVYLTNISNPKED